MATLTFSFDTGSVPLSRIVNALAYKYGYENEITDPENEGSTIPNPESKADFVREQFRVMVINFVKGAEILQARAAAEETIEEIILD